MLGSSFKVVPEIFREGLAFGFPPEMAETTAFVNRGSGPPVEKQSSGF